MVETVAYFSSQSLCLKRKCGAFYPARRAMQREYYKNVQVCIVYKYGCYNFPFSYSVGLLLILFLAFNLIAMGNPNDGRDRLHCSKAGVGKVRAACVLQALAEIYQKYILRSSDGLVVRASASEVVDVGLIPSPVKPMTLKLVFTASLLDAQH